MELAPERGRIVVPQSKVTRITEAGTCFAVSSTTTSCHHSKRNDHHNNSGSSSNNRTMMAIATVFVDSDSNDLMFETNDSNFIKSRLMLVSLTND